MVLFWRQLIYSTEAEGFQTLVRSGLFSGIFVGMFLVPDCKLVQHSLQQIVSSIINSLGTSAGASLGMDPVVIFEANYANYFLFLLEI
jgi:hypothetical protein